MVTRGLFVCFCAIAVQASAQEVTGNILGRVTDPSGSAVTNATVTVKNTAQGATLRTLKTDSSGDYAATLLPVGNYSVAVEAPGFKKATIDNIQLTANQKFTADAKLEVGQVSQEVTITEETNQVELQTSQQSGLISGTQVRELSLNNRNFTQLVVLQPGVVSNLSDQTYLGTTNPTGGNNIAGLSINGLRQSQNNWTLDGADLLDRGSNITLQQYPSIDAIEEIKIVRSPYSAENGRAGGGQISAITRSGTNNLHGSAYEFFRNDALNANNFFNNSGKIARPPLRYNDFGYTVGGPVIIPRIYNGKDKTFFFFSEEFRRVINYNAATVQVPTQAEQQGIFPNPVCVAVSADGASCTQTSTSIGNINPVAQSYIKDVFSKIPPPQSGNNLFTPLRGVFNARQEITRIDHNFGEKLTLSGRYLHDSIPTIEPGGLFTNNFTPGVATTQTNSPGWSSVIRATSTFSPTLVNEAGWAWSHGGIFSNPVGLMASANSPDVKPALILPGNPSRIPTLAFIGGLTGISSYGPYNNFSYNHSIFDNITKTVARHTIKAGAVFFIYRKNENQLADNSGVFAFSNTPRPDANVTLEQSWANFLLGNVASFTQTSQDLTADLRSKTFEAYVQDDFRLRSNLTINLGIRYSNFRQPTDHNGLLTSFDPARFNAATAFRVDPATGNRIAGAGDPFNGIIQGSKNSPFGDAIAKQNNLDFAPRFGFAWDPFGNGKTSVRGGYGIFYDSTLVGSLEQNIATNPTTSFTAPSIANTRLDNPSAGSPVVSLSPPTLRGWDPAYKDPYIQQWDLEIQRHLPGDTLVSVAYVGTKGTHLTGIIDINQVPPGAAAAAGLVPAGGYINAAIRPRLNALRPYPGYNAINMINSGFDSNYNGLQTGLTKRFGSTGGEVNVAYTFSKSITDNASDRSNAPQNTYNIKGDRGLAVLDRRHVFTASYVYPLPFLRNAHNLLGQVAGGWELSGIVTYNTGLPLTVNDATGVDPGGLGSANNPTSSSSPRPDQIGNPNAGPRTIAQWFNTAAFAEVPVGANRPGNTGRFTVEGPPITRWDFSVFKEFAVRERAKLQLRGESFNVLNHTNFMPPNVSFGNVNFGKITTARDPRQIQIGAKLLF
jgi:hypothetical protein